MCLWGNGVIKHITSDPNIQVLENLMQFTDRLSQFSLYFLGLNASLVKKCNMVELLSYCSFSDAQAVNKSDVRFRAWQPLSNVEHRNRSEAACCREVPPPLPPSAHPLSLGFVGKVDLCWSPGVPNVVYQTFCTPGHSSYMFIQFTLAFTKKNTKKKNQLVSSSAIFLNYVKLLPAVTQFLVWQQPFSSNHISLLWLFFIPTCCFGLLELYKY